MTLIKKNSSLSKENKISDLRSLDVTSSWSGLKLSLYQMLLTPGFSLGVKDSRKNGLQPCHFHLFNTNNGEKPIIFFIMFFMYLNPDGKGKQKTGNLLPGLKFYLC